MLTVVFISRSEGRGHARALAILDRYAFRIGERTWQTPITEEGLSVLRKHLRKVATRQVAVSCFLRTRRGMAYRWSVGKKVVMQDDGSIPVHQGKVERRRQVPTWLSLACLLNEAAGLAHDFGKAGNAFQDKLRDAAATGAIIADPVRHEWISMHMLSSIIRGEDWATAWSTAQALMTKRALSLTGTPFARWKPQTTASSKSSLGTKNKKQPPSVQDNTLPGMVGWESYLHFIVGSHHRLPQNHNDPALAEKKPTQFNLRAAEGAQTFFAGRTPLKAMVNDEQRKKFAFRHAVSDKVLHRFRSLVHRVEKMVSTLPEATTSNPDFWLAMAFMSRPAFILADHDRSSVVMPPREKTDDPRGTAACDDPTALFANTARGADGKKNVLNQSLDWHLDAVGSYASKILTEGLVSMDLPSVPMDVVSRLAEDTKSPRHLWQNTSAGALRDTFGNADTGPVLMFNMAGTGQGKTRMNMRLLATLALHQHRPLRVATMLNLRSLTLQTFDAYEQQLGLNASLLAGVIGDHVTRRLHDESKQTGLEKDDDDHLVADVDGNPILPTFEAVGSDEWDEDAPGWLKHALHAKADLKKIVMAPVAVCTTDFLVTAGDLTRQGNHALAFLRIASSDLILDEIDSYDPNALVTVMRMVMLAALCGRNVVASSATLTEECAKALWIGWKRGISMRQALLNAAPNAPTLAVKVLMLDHLQQPVLLPFLPPSDDQHAARQKAHENFEGTYRKFLTTMMTRVADVADATDASRRHTPRLATIIDIQGLKRSLDGNVVPSEDNRIAFYETILQQAKTFHHAHGFSLPGDERTISFGLVRVANINVAIPLARYLAEQTAQWSGITVKVTCYHSRTTRLRRHFLEKRLDALLQRSNEQETLFKDPELRRDLVSAKQHVMFIVVATPVEEIGRDHDFDYGIAEPSSTQSLVQTPGRINRHRQKHVDTPNFAIMNYNMRAIVPSKGDNNNYFCRPGLDDDAKNPFIGNSVNLWTISMEHLLGHRVGDVWPLDARLKFERDPNNPKSLLRKFSILESDALKRRLADVFEIFEDPYHQAHFLQTGLYRFFLLREKMPGEEEHTIEFFNADETPGGRVVHHHSYQKLNKSMAKNEVEIQQLGRVSNDWLVLDDAAAMKMAQDLNLPTLDALGVSLKMRSGQTLEQARWHASFGMEILNDANHGHGTT